LKLIALRVVLLLFFAWALLTVRIDAPFFGHHEGAGLWISAAVRNFDLYGAAQLGYVPVINYSTATAQTYSYYVNHPPMIVWLTAGMAQLTGLSSTTVRFVAASLTLMSIAGVYVIGRRLFNTHIGFWAAVFYVMTPMILYYGRSPNHEPLTLAIMTVYAAVLRQWTHKPTRARLSALTGLAVLAGLSSWAAVLAVSLMSAITFVITRKRELFAPVGGMLVGLVAFVGLYQRQWDGAIAQIASSFGARSSATQYYDAGISFTTSEFLTRQIIESLLFFMPGLLLLSTLGSRAAFRRLNRAGAGMLLALFVTGFGYILLLRSAAYEHDFLKIFLTVPLSITAAVAWVHLLRTPRQFMIKMVMTLVIASWIGAGGVWLALHYGGSLAQRDPMIMVNTLRDITQPDDLILANRLLPAGVSYYAFRDVRGGIDEQRWTRHADVNADTLYMRCYLTYPPLYPITGRLIARDEVCQYFRR